jgi:hypothetical protein
MALGETFAGTRQSTIRIEVSPSGENSSRA